MSIETLVAKIHQLRRSDGDAVPPPASEPAIAALTSAFEAAFGMALPAAYQRILRLSDGLLFDGLTLWPTEATALLRESLSDANIDLRETIDDELVYFGQRDDVLFVYDPRKQRYAAIELPSLTEWESFEDADALMIFMLERVVDPEVKA